MKIFCSYAYTGENLVTVKTLMRSIVDILQANGHIVYCDLFNEEIQKLVKSDNVRDIFATDFKILENHDAVYAFVTANKKSIGQAMEIGVALSNDIPFYLFEHESAAGSTYLPKLANKTYVYKTTDDLLAILSEL